MSRLALLVVGLVALPGASPAWALFRAPACRSAGPAPGSVAPDSLMCMLAEDPWQDCDEDPWQLTSPARQDDGFLDPWQDEVDPWQPSLAGSSLALATDAIADPWQPVTSRLVLPPAAPSVPEADDDPWQPSVIDPWQDGGEDPWQVP
jgi:hypothetical protein